MTAPLDPGSKPLVCRSEDGHYYIRNERVMSEVLTHIRNGDYCAIMGPRYTQKTWLLRDIYHQLNAENRPCIEPTIAVPDVATKRKFLSDFAAKVYRQALTHTRSVEHLQATEVADERSLQHFLQELVRALNQDLVLLLNRLEWVPLPNLEALLLALRAVYVAQQDTTNRLCVVAATSVNLVDLSLGPTSPFNVAHVIWVKDLDQTESAALALRILGQKGKGISQYGLIRIFEVTNGDRYLIPSLCEHCADAVSQHEISKKDIDDSLHWFLEKKADEYKPLRGTLIALETEPSVLLSAFEVLQRRKVFQKELNLDAETGVDRLKLSGAVRVEEEDGCLIFRPRNEIYEAFLKKHLEPTRVSSLLRSRGQQEQTLAYFERLFAGNQVHRGILIDALVNSIVVAKDQAVACKYLFQGLKVAFGISRARIFLSDVNGSQQGAAYQMGLEADPQSTTIAFVPKESRDRFRICNVADGEVLRVTLHHDERTLALADIYDFKFDRHEVLTQELDGFLMRAGGALGEVLERERSLHPVYERFERKRQTTNPLDLKQVLSTVVEEAARAIPGADSGAVFLWDKSIQRLAIAGCWGFPDNVSEVLLSSGEGYVGWVHKNDKPVLVDNAQQDPRTVRWELLKERSAICVPLHVADQILGTLCVQNKVEYNAFQPDDLETLYSFANQAALAIHTARLSTELYNLGISVNTLGQTPEGICRATLRSVLNVTGAKAAKLLLLRDTDSPPQSISQPPLLSLSLGLTNSSDGDVATQEDLQPRPDGVTFRMLSTRMPVAVPGSDVEAGLHPALLAMGINAYCAVPLIAREAILGGLFVHYEQVHEFSDNEVRTLRLFADQAALGLDNARQHDKLMVNASVAWMGISFSMLAHRITQRMATIKVILATLRESLASIPGACRLLDDIEHNTSEINQIPSLSLLPEDQAELMDMNQILRDEVPRWCGHDIAVTFELSPCGLNVVADRRRIAFLIEILMTNAVRALRESMDRQVEIQTEHLGQRVEVRIANSGRPIPKEIQALLFSRPIPKLLGGRGSGVGLLIAQSIVAAYRGEIWCDKSDCDRTIFAFSLPLHL